ncbi:MAG: dihydrodipicolinate synthase family protein [Pararobbsia sp.]
MSHTSFRGIIAYPVTPFGQDGAPDIPMLERLVDRLVTQGSHAIAPLGSTGESAYLSDDEWDEVAEHSIRQVAKRVPVVIGISDLTTRSAMRRARFAEAAGADAVMVLPLAYWKLSEAEIFAHYAAIADATTLPVMVYNNPATSGVDMSPELIVKLASEIDNVTMVKESSGDIQRMHRIAQLSDGQLPFYNGSNPLAFEAFAAGATGWCTAAPNLIADYTLQLYEHCAAGNLRKAREIFFAQLPILQFILKGGLPTTIKAGLRSLGFEAGDPRAPLQPLGRAGCRDLQMMLEQLTRRPM